MNKYRSRKINVNGFVFDPNKKASKYKSRKITVDGITFDSKKEFRRFQELSYYEREGKIIDLQRQVKFVLIPAQHKTIERYSKKTGKRLKDEKKLLERECAYIADFVYKVPERSQKPFCAADGKVVAEAMKMDFRTIVEDTKGIRTKDYVIKRKLMLWIHGIQIKEV